MNIRFKRGDTPRYELELTRDGQALASPDAVVHLHARRRVEDEEPVIDKVLSLVDGKWILQFEEADTTGFTKTERLGFDIEVRETDGNVDTPIEGMMLVVADWTREQVE
jgi:hypothetical protein